MKNKFVGLIILDGYGIRDEEFGNAIKLSKSNKLGKYFKNYPYTELDASGESVGLPHGQMGNSEVGHLNIGAGKVVKQSLQQINESISSGAFFVNKALLNAINHCKDKGSVMHLVGLVSDGGVHSHVNHLHGLVNLAKQNAVQKVKVHIITDGRDSFTDASINEIVKIEKLMSGFEGYKIATVSGRFYAMDREGDFNRTETAYNSIVFSNSNYVFESALEGVRYFHNKGITDEFIPPFIVKANNNSKSISSEKPLKNSSGVSDNDSVIFYNFRADRMRQLSAAFLKKGFSKFKTKVLKNVAFATFAKYDNFINDSFVAFKKEAVLSNLSKVVSENGLLQFKITETTKYAHLTYFLNGGREVAYENEDRFLIETIKTDYFEKHPQMRAKEITDKAIDLISLNKYNLMVLNYSNCDMIGHTGDLNATIEAVKTVDKEADRLIEQILSAGGVAVVCADHGNAEHMIDNSGRILTDHTTNKVPFCVIGENYLNISLKSGGKLSNIAPTVLQLLNINAPKEWEESLII